MSARLRLLGWAHVLIGGAGLIVCAAMLAAFAGSGDSEYGDEAIFFGWLLGWSAILCFVPSFAGGIGLLRGKRWGRAVLWAESAVLALAVPVGTVLSGLTIWGLLSTVDLSADGGMAGIERSLKRAGRALALALVALFLLGVIIGAGYLFRDVISPPVQQDLTPLPSGRPKSPQQPDFEPPPLPQGGR